MSPRYIITRSLTVIFLIVVALYAVSFVKKTQRKNAIVSELKSVASESSFFRQFSAADAKKSLVRGVGLIAEAKKLGMEPETVIERGLGIEKKYFASDDDRDGLTPKQVLIRSTLRSNYENFLKIGYETDFYTLQSLREGELPPVGNGSREGSRAEVVPIIDPTLSPGLDTVIANLEIRPKRSGDTKKTDVEIAIAKRLAKDLEKAGVIDKEVSVRIVAALDAKE
ncbi:MAG: hypothetical protein ACSHX9_10180 [Luteolibacter sp.]